MTFSLIRIVQTHRSSMQFITTQPVYVSAEEHATLTASTPTSFADIPPVLLHLEEDVEVTLEPAMPELSGSADGARVRGKLWVTERWAWIAWARHQPRD